MNPKKVKPNAPNDPPPFVPDEPVAAVVPEVVEPVSIAVPASIGVPPQSGADLDKTCVVSLQDLLALTAIIESLASGAGDSLARRQQMATPALELIDSLLK